MPCCGLSYITRCMESYSSEMLQKLNCDDIQHNSSIPHYHSDYSEAES